MNPQENLYDIAIIGSGPAGYSASIYASRYKLKNAIFGKVLGGTISTAHKVCNYPGFEDITGMELAMKMQEHAKKEGGETITESVVDVKREDNLFKITTDAPKEYFAKTVILATGTDRNKLAIPGEDKYVGKGLSYCATCDAMFYRDKVVAVIGGSNAAAMAATMLSDIVKKVYIIYRGCELRCEPVWAEQAMNKENIEIIYDNLVTGIEGETKVERIKLAKEFNGSEYLDVNGIFVEIGCEPNITLPVTLGIKVDEKNYVIVDDEQKTSIDGIWAAGDCTANSNYLKQVVTAVSEGAVASNSIYSYLKKQS